MVTVRQIKAARALLGWSQRDLAEQSGVSLPTIASLEQYEGELGGREATRKKLLAAFDCAGLQFLNAVELGVTLRRAKWNGKRVSAPRARSNRISLAG
jgi:transcriptional regulator with XRE-family HTH domain